MIFTIKSRNEKFLKNIYEKSMNELDDFFGINWKRNRPRIFLVQDRKTINELRGMKTAEWVVGWVDKHDIFLLDKENYEKESNHKYSDKEYARLMKHELSHAFFLVASGFKYEPKWLFEGVAIYLSGQYKERKKPDVLKNFLKFYSVKNKDPAVYRESGFAVEFLVKNFGKQRLVRLIKSLKNINSEQKFAEEFRKIYGFELDYKNFSNKFTRNI